MVITDYVAEGLLYYRFFDDVTDINQLRNKVITVDNFTIGLKIVGIVETNAKDFIKRS